jgi:hypothetical protein
MEQKNGAYRMEHNGKEYQMGLSVREVGRGDVVKIGPGRLEEIASVDGEPGRSWSVQTTNGNTYSMWDIAAYGSEVKK